MSAEIAAFVPEFGSRRTSGRTAEVIPLTLHSPTLASDLEPQELVTPAHHELPVHHRSVRRILAAVVLLTVGFAAVALVVIALTRF